MDWNTDPLFWISLFLFFNRVSLSKHCHECLHPPSCLLSSFSGFCAPRRRSSSLAQGSRSPAASELLWRAESHLLSSPLLSPLSLQPEPASGIRCLRRRSTPTAPFLSLFPPFVRFSFACNSSSPPYFSFTVSKRRELKAQKVVLLQILLETTWDL